VPAGPSHHATDRWSNAVKSAVETLNPTRVKLTVEVPFDELKPSLDAAYREIGQQIQVPGFRKGHIPARIIDQRVGRAAVLQEAVNDALPQFYNQAVEEAHVHPLGQPQVDLTEVPIEDGQQLVFTAEVDIRPEIVLPDLDGIAVEVEPVVVDDEDIDDRLTVLRQRFGTLTGVERVVGAGDFVSIDLAAAIGDAEIDAVTGVSYEVGSHQMLPGLDDALLGMATGETKTFQAPLAGGDHEGEPADCTVTVQAVKERVLPELDDAFAQLASEFDTLADLREDLRKEAAKAKVYVQGVQARDRLVDVLLTTVEFPVPEGLIEAEVKAHLENEGKEPDDEHGVEVAEETRKGLRVQLLLDAIAEDRKVNVDQSDLIEYLVMSSQQYGMEPNEFAKMVDERGQIPVIVGEVARRKALASVLAKATVTDTDGNVVDLEALNPPKPAAEAADVDTDTDAADA
jgi:trigger factor